VRYGTCPLGLGVRVQGRKSALRDVSSWTRSQSPGPEKCVTGRVLLDSESESRAGKVRYGTCPLGLGVRVQGRKSALRDVSSWTRSQSPGPEKCVTGRVLLDSESESRAGKVRYGTCPLGLGVRVQGRKSALRDVSSWTRSQSPGRPGRFSSESESRAPGAFQLFARAWTRSQSPGRPGRFSCSRGHGLGVRVQGARGVSVVRAGMDSESESRAPGAFQLFARAWTRSQSPGRPGRFSCSRGHGLGVRVQGARGVSVVRAGMDSDAVFLFRGVLKLNFNLAQGGSSTAPGRVSKSVSFEVVPHALLPGNKI
jgi:hypothetical protein